MFMISMVSAFESSLDDKKFVSPDKTLITYVDTALFSEDTTLAEFELKTPHVNQIGLGYQQYFEYEIRNTYEDISDMIGDVEVYNVNDNMKPTNLPIDLKYKVITNEKGIEKDCSMDNKTFKETCVDVPYDRDVVSYEDYTPKTIIKGETITISGWGYANEGDHYEWIPNFYNDKLRVEEWASWTADLNTDIVAYWNFEEASGDLLDQVVSNDGTNDGCEYGTAGIIDDCWTFVAANTDFVTIPDNAALKFASGDFSVQAWVKYPETASTLYIINKGTEEVGGIRWTIQIASTAGAIYWSIDDNTAAKTIKTTGTNYDNDAWHHVVGVRDGNNLILYVDGSAETPLDITGYGSLDTTEDLKIGARSEDDRRNWEGEIDEVGIWNRTLSPEEVTQLYNGGAGITYTDVFTTAAEITLNSPADASTFSTQSITFNTTVTDDQQVANVTLYIDDIAEQTNTSNFNGTYIFTETLTEGEHTWKIGAWNNQSLESNSSTRTIIIDTTTPFISAVMNTPIVYNPADNVTINFTASDTNLDTCWWRGNSGGAIVHTGLTFNCSETQLNIIANSTYAFNNIQLVVNDTAGNVNASAYVVWAYDSIAPEVEHLSPLIFDQNNSNPMGVTVGYNITAVNKDTCWYDLGNSTNVTLNCSATSQVINLASGQWNVTLYANDTIGNENSTTASFYINAFTETFDNDNPAVEQEPQTLIMHLANLSYLSSLVGNLTYNGTNYVGTVDNDTISVTLNTPAVTVNTDVNFSFTYLLNNESFTTSNQTQTIQNLAGIEVGTSCSAGLSEAMYFNFKAENNLTAHNGTANYLFRYGITNSSSRTTSGTVSNVAGFYLCINSTVYNNYSMGLGEIQYERTGFTDRRYYNFQGDKLTNVTQNHTLYSLNNADSTSFLFTVQAPDLNPYVENYLSLNRWYPELDQYNTVELARTDDKGQTVMKVYTENVDYRLGVYETNGTLLFLSDPFRLVCAVSPCNYLITITGDTGQLFETWSSLNSSITYDNGTFTYVYNDPTQTTDSMTFKVYKMTGTADVEICSDNATGFTSVMYCNVSGYTGQLKAVGFRTASPQVAVISRIESVYADSIAQDMGVIITLGVMFILVMVGIVSPVLTVILAIVGLIPAITFGIVPLQVMLIFGAIGFIVIAYMRKT